MQFKWTLTGVDETILFAESLAKKLRPGDIITLEGDLGAGKTTFTKGLAKGLGITRNVSSPTYTIIKEYKGSMPLYHMDVYRLENSSEDLGFEEYFEGEGVTVVEWAQFIEDQLPDAYLQINISYIDEHIREMTLLPTSTRYEKLCKELIENESFSN